MPNEMHLALRYLPVGELQPYPHNARKHSKHQIRQIAASIREFGFTNPVLVDRNHTIVAGHGRVEAAKMLGMETVPVLQLDQLTEEQVRAYILADNKLAENAGWDKSILAIELQHLLTLADLDVTVTGFEVPEIDVIIEEAAGGQEHDDELPVPDGPAITRPGDLWQLGKHRILCGDSLKEQSFQALMGAKRATMVFSDPPYNVAIDGNVCGKGSVRHREFQMASGEMSEVEFTAFLNRALCNLSRYSSAASLHFLCMDWRHMKELLAAAGERFTTRC